MFSVLIFIDPNSHGEPLHHFHVVPGRIFRGKEAKERASGTRKALHFALVVAPEGVDADRDRLTWPHPFELRLFKVGRDPNVVQGNDHEQALSRLDAVAEFYSLASDHAADRRENLRIAEVELSSAQIGTGL